jgi:hypothetical protein
VLKEKLKLLKGRLKIWHQRYMASLDVKGEVQGLEEEVIEKIHLLYTDVVALSNLHSSIQWHNSRINWLNAGDANSKKNSLSDGFKKKVECYYFD